MLLASKLNRLKLSLMAATLEKAHLKPLFDLGLVQKTEGSEQVASKALCRKVEIFLEHVFHASARVSAEAIGETLAGKKFKNEDEAVAYCGVLYLLELDTIKSGYELLAMLFKVPKEYQCLREILYEAVKKSCSKAAYEKVQKIVEMYDLDISAMLQQQADEESELMQEFKNCSAQLYPAHTLYYGCEFIDKEPVWQQFYAWKWIEEHEPQTAANLFNNLLEAMREAVPTAADIISSYRLIFKVDAADSAKDTATVFHRPISPLEMAERVQHAWTLRLG